MLQGSQLGMQVGCQNVSHQGSEQVKPMVTPGVIAWGSQLEKALGKPQDCRLGTVEVCPPGRLLVNASVTALVSQQANSGEMPVGTLRATRLVTGGEWVGV